jgi:hypothetical protein
LGDEGIFADLAKPGALKDQLQKVLALSYDPDAPSRRRETVRSRFSWPVLAPQYREMFFDCARVPLRRRVKD